jgi:hypothetical protein
MSETSDASTNSDESPQNGSQSHVQPALEQVASVMSVLHATAATPPHGGNQEQPSWFVHAVSSRAAHDSAPAHGTTFDQSHPATMQLSRSEYVEHGSETPWHDAGTEASSLVLASAVGAPSTPASPASAPNVANTYICCPALGTANVASVLVVEDELWSDGPVSPQTVTFHDMNCHPLEGCAVRVTFAPGSYAPAAEPSCELPLAKSLTQIPPSQVPARDGVYAPVVA